jgi:glycosyltransferase involved in cell wall biosynthesis
MAITNTMVQDKAPDASQSGQRTLKGVVIMPLAEQRGGGEMALWHLILEGGGQGIDWTVVFLEDGPMVAQVRSVGAGAVVFEAGRMREVHKLLLTARRIAGLVKREKMDFILGWMGTGQLYGGIAARLAGVPALWFQHGLPLVPGAIDRIATRLPAKAIFTCSQAGANAQGAISPARPLRVIHPGVELDRFDPAKLPTPAEARAKLGLPADGPIIGIIGRLQRWKGMHVLVDAMPRVLEKYPDARVVVVGGAHIFEPEYEPFLKQHIEEKGLTDRVLLTGLQKNVPEWMQAMDIVVHASDNEPFGLVIIEAMALGKPVVATDTAGPTEIITPGVHGLLTPYGDADRLAEAVLRYLDDPAFAAGVGAAAKQRAGDFSVKRYASRIVQHCREFVV